MCYLGPSAVQLPIDYYRLSISGQSAGTLWAVVDKVLSLFEPHTQVIRKSTVIGQAAQVSQVPFQASHATAR